MKTTLRKLYTELRRQAAGVDAILTTWLARESTSEKLRRLEARCATLERERLSIFEQWLGAHERQCRALGAGDVDTLEAAAMQADVALAQLTRRKSFMRITIDQYEDEPIPLHQIVAGEALVPAFPVPSGQSIRLRHPRQCDFGFRPRYLDVSLELSDEQRNYSDYQLQLQLVGPSYERPIGDPMLGSRFHNADGSRILVPFPRHHGNPVIVGTLEHLEVLIRNRGTASALIAASVGVGLCSGRVPGEQRLG